MILDTTSKSIQVVLGAPVTTTQAQIFASYADITPTTFAPASTDVASNNTTPVTVVAAPAASTQRQVKTLQVYNADTSSMAVVVQLLDGATTRVLYKITLAPGSTLMYAFGEGMRVTDTNGNFLESVQAQQSGSWSVSIAGTPNVNLADVGGGVITLGQKTSANSLPVVIASDQSTVNVAVVSPATSYGQAILTTTAATSIGGASFTKITGIQVVSVGVTCASTPILIQIKDGSATVRANVNVPAPSATAFAPFEAMNIVGLSIALTNGGNPVTLTMGANLTAGYIIATITFSM